MERNKLGRNLADQCGDHGLLKPPAYFIWDQIGATVRLDSIPQLYHLAFGGPFRGIVRDLLLFLEERWGHVE